MGKGTIISGGTDGQYQVQKNYNRTAYDAELSKLTSQILAYTIKITETEDEKTKAVLKISKLSFEKRKQYLENNMPADETISAWCADLTEDLTGIVGTVEIPGETAFIQIQPGYESNAVYNIPRDGQLLPLVVATPAQAFYNLATMPGWQKWKPLFRYGTITAIDGDTASVAVEGITSSQQSLVINQTDSLSDVAIEYMNCNGGAFEIDDEVLLKFEGQAWDSPVIVGFKDNPKACDTRVVLFTNRNSSGRLYYLHDLNKDVEYDIYDDGTLISQPFYSSNLSSILSENGLSHLSVSTIFGEAGTYDAEKTSETDWPWPGYGWNTPGITSPAYEGILNDLSGNGSISGTFERSYVGQDLGPNPGVWTNKLVILSINEKTITNKVKFVSAHEHTELICEIANRIQYTKTLYDSKPEKSQYDINDWGVMDLPRKISLSYNGFDSLYTFEYVYDTTWDDFLFFNTSVYVGMNCGIEDFIYDQYLKDGYHDKINTQIKHNEELRISGYLDRLESEYYEDSVVGSLFVCDFCYTLPDENGDLYQGCVTTDFLKFIFGDIDAFGYSFLG